MAKLKASNRVIVPTGDIPFEGDQSMGLNKLVDLSPATNPADAVRFDQLTTGSSPVSGIDLQGNITGLNYRIDPTNPTTKIIVGVGYCFDSTGTKLLHIDSEMTKQITLDWSIASEGGKAVGSQILGLGQMWHVFLIGNDSGQMSIVIDDNETNNNIQGDYIYRRWLGYIWTNHSGNDLVPFWFAGNELTFDGQWLLPPIWNVPFSPGVIYQHDLSNGAPMSKLHNYHIGFWGHGAFVASRHIGGSLLGGASDWGPNLHVTNTFYNNTYTLAAERHYPIPASVPAPFFSYYGTGAGAVMNWSIAVGKVFLNR